jgi:hypothetical protein
MSRRRQPRVADATRSLFTVEQGRLDVLRRLDGHHHPAISEGNTGSCRMTAAVLDQDTRAVGRGRPGVRWTYYIQVRLEPPARDVFMWSKPARPVPNGATVGATGDEEWHGTLTRSRTRTPGAAIRSTVRLSLLITGAQVLMSTVISHPFGATPSNIMEGQGV